MGQEGVAVTKLCRHTSSFCKETEEAHFNPRAETSSENQSRCPSHASLDMKKGMVETENEVGRMGHHLWETHKNTKTRNAICSHCTIQHQLLTLCHLHGFVLDHLGDLPFSETWWVANPLWMGRVLPICFSHQGGCVGLVCSRTGCTLPSFCLSCKGAAR